MDFFVVYNLTFNIDEHNNIILDKSSAILKHRFCYTKNRELEIQKSKKIINDICDCIAFCKQINNHYKSFRCLESIEYIENGFVIQNDIKTKIYNTLDNNITKNIFSLKDIDFLKRIVKTKLETLEKYVSTAPDNTVKQNRDIQRSRLLTIKEQLYKNNKNEND